MKLNRKDFRAVLDRALDEEIGRGRDGYLTIETELTELLEPWDMFDVPRNGRQLLVACIQVVYLLQYIHEPAKYASEHPKDIISTIISGTTHGELIVRHRVTEFLRFALIEARKYP